MLRDLTKMLEEHIRIMEHLAPVHKEGSQIMGDLTRQTREWVRMLCNLIRLSGDWIRMLEELSLRLQELFHRMVQGIRLLGQCPGHHREATIIPGTILLVVFRDRKPPLACTMSPVTVRLGRPQRSGARSNMNDQPQDDARRSRQRPEPRSSQRPEVRFEQARNDRPTYGQRQAARDSRNDQRRNDPSRSSQGPERGYEEHWHNGRGREQRPEPRSSTGRFFNRVGQAMGLDRDPARPRLEVEVVYRESYGPGDYTSSDSSDYDSSDCSGYHPRPGFAINSPRYDPWNH